MRRRRASQASSRGCGSWARWWCWSCSAASATRSERDTTTVFGSHLKSGQCVTTSDYEKFNFTSTSCESSDAVYELAGETSKGLCPDGKAPSEGPYFYATSNQDDPEAASLCFALNLHEGDCYALDLTGKSVRNIECAQAPAIANSHTGVFKVAQRVDDSTDESACATAAKAMVFTSPKRVYCLSKLVE